MKLNPPLRVHTIALLGTLTAAGLAAAQTSFSGGNYENGDNWTNGLPASGNPGTMAMDGTWGGSTTGFGTGSVVDLTDGTLTANGVEGFNMNAGGTWNMSGGKIIARYFLANGPNSVFNLAGGTWEMSDQDGTQHMGAANGGTLLISGSATLDGSFATVEVQTIGGTIDIAAGWSGSWTWGTYSGTEWRLHFENGEILLGGDLIDGATFDSSFVVTNGGQTLSLVAPVLPTAFNGGDLLTAGDWTNGLPVNPTEGTVAADGTYDDGGTGSADWLLTMTGGTITASQDWSFTGTSRIGISGGTLDVAGDILVEDTTVMTFDGGTVSWGGRFDTGASIDSKIVINAGTFDGTATGTTSFGNGIGSGELILTGGTISASVFDFSNTSALSTLGGTAVLDGASASFGALDIGTDWTGSFTLATFSGTDWEDEFLTGNITLDGGFLDTDTFALNFTVSNGGQTITYTPSTTLLVDGDITMDGGWDNGLPSNLKPGTIAVDGTHSVTVFGFGGDSVVDMTAGTITSTDGFNLFQGGTWNISGGKIVTRYFLSNSQVQPAVVNLSGGTIELSDVEGTQHMGVGNGGELHISGPAVLDGTHATQEVQTAGTLDIQSNWSGTWTWGIYSGTDWENLFLSGGITLDGAVLDQAGFAASFVVTNDGQTLARGSGGTPDQDPPTLEVIGVNGLDELVIRATHLNASKTYDLRRGTDLVSFPDYVGAPVTGTTEIDFTDDNRPAGQAFYQLEEQ